MATSALNERENQEWPSHGIEPVTACPVCGSRQRTRWHAGLRDHVFFCAPGVWQMQRCDDCGSGYLDPRPTVDSIDLAYQTYYTHQGSDVGEAVVADTVGRFAGAKRALRNAYLRHEFGIDLGPGWRLGHQIVRFFFPMRARAFGSWFRHLRLPHQGARLLDVGCGNGDFLRRAFRVGWQAEGIDPDPSALAAANNHGLRVQPGSLPATTFPNDAFHAITLNHVMEHLHDPVAGLRELFRILRPGGWLWMTTPNAASPLHRQFGSAWRGLEPPRHLVVFTHRSLHQACRSVGFEHMRAVRSVPVGEWILRASLKVKHRIPSHEDLQRALTLRERMTARLWNATARLRPEWGEEIVLLAQKPET